VTHCVSPSASCATMNRQAEFDDLELDRNRYLNLGFILSGTAKDGEHKRHLQKASLIVKTEEVLDDFDGEDDGQSSPIRHSQDFHESKKPVSKHGLSRRTVPTASAKLTDKSFGKSRAAHDDNLDANEMIVNLSF
jgi:hypothetical protein